MSHIGLAKRRHATHVLREVYDTLDELKDNVPQELYEAVAQALKGDLDGVEYLDI